MASLLIESDQINGVLTSAMMVARETATSEVTQNFAGLSSFRSGFQQLPHPFSQLFLVSLSFSLCRLLVLAPPRFLFIPLTIPSSVDDETRPVWRVVYPVGRGRNFQRHASAI